MRFSITKLAILVGRDAEAVVRLLGLQKAPSSLKGSEPRTTARNPELTGISVMNSQEDACPGYQDRFDVLLRLRTSTHKGSSQTYGSLTSSRQLEQNDAHSRTQDIKYVSQHAVSIHAELLTVF